MKRRCPLVCVSAVLACGLYLACAALAYTRYPLPFSPAAHWLSDLGDRRINPQGAPFYNVGIIALGFILFLWFMGLAHWRVEANRPQRWLLGVAQAAGTLGSISVSMSGVFPIDLLQQHAFWSRAHYMMLAMGFGFSVTALAHHPRFPRPLLYLGTLAAFSPLATLLGGEVYWLEWLSVGLFLVYVLLVGMASRAVTPKAPSG